MNARHRRAFCIAELAAILAVLSVLFTLAAVAQDRARRTARLGDDLVDLRQMGNGFAFYSADFQDRIATFSWKKGQSLSQWADLNEATSDMQAAANQAVDLLRRRGRPDMPGIPNWIPHILYNHLILQEYLGQPLADLSGVSSGDKHRTKWAQDPEGFDEGKFLPFQPSPTNPTNKRWPYSSSYQLVVAACDKSDPPDRISQLGGTHAQYYLPSQADLGGHPISATAFPSQKVLLHDGSARHFEPRAAYATHDEARLPLLFVDGSVSLRAAKDANPGWMPNTPNSSSPTTFWYVPQTWEPPALSGSTFDSVIGRFRWTRGGIGGRDFGGPEFPQPPK